MRQMGKHTFLGGTIEAQSPKPDKKSKNFLWRAVMGCDSYSSLTKGVKVPLLSERVRV